MQKSDPFLLRPPKIEKIFKKSAALLDVSEKCPARINTLQSYLWTRGRLSQSSSTQPCLEDLPQLESCAATRLSSWSRRTFPSKPPNNGVEQRPDKESVDCWGCSEDSSPWRLTRIHVTTDNGNCTCIRQKYILAVFYLHAWKFIHACSSHRLSRQKWTRAQIFGEIVSIKTTINNAVVIGQKRKTQNPVKSQLLRAIKLACETLN